MPHMWRLCPLLCELHSRNAISHIAVVPSSVQIGEELKYFVLPFWNWKDGTQNTVKDRMAFEIKWYIRKIRSSACPEYCLVYQNVFGPTDWPARSPDIRTLYFYLRGYVKGRIYVTIVRDHRARILEISIRKILKMFLGIRVRPLRKVDNLTAICGLIV
jgi:hypothetical protein